MEQSGKSYRNIVWECKSCRYVEEVPDRTIPKKAKIRIERGYRWSY